jgi:hypothetical protein
MKIRTSCVMLLWTICVASAADSTLATAHISQLGHGTRAILNGIPFSVVEFSDGSTPTGQELFAGRSYFPSDVGQPIVATAANEVGFNAFVSSLTDGQFDYVTYHIPFERDYSSEANFFTLPPGNNGVDFQGFRISSVVLVFNQLSFTSPGRNPNGDGLWTDFSFTADLSIIGSPIPEPSGGMLLSAGLLILCGQRWLRNGSKGVVPVDSRSKNLCLTV